MQGLAVVALALASMAVSGASAATEAPAAGRGKGTPGTPTDPLVQLEKGAVRGTGLRSSSGRDILAFMGVPFARPPVGKYRFKVR